MLSYPSRFRAVKAARRRPSNRRRFRPVLVALEDRQLLASFTWASNVDGAFNVATNWLNQNNQHGVPGPADSASIPFGGITVTSPASVTVNNLSSSCTLSITGGTFTVANQAASTSIGKLILAGGTTFATTGGTSTFSDTGTYAGTFSASAGAKIAFGGGGDAVNSGTTFAGAGLFDVTGATLTLNTNITAPKNFEMDGGVVTGSGTLTIPSTNTFTWTGGSFDGPGTTVVSAGATANLSGAGNKFVTNSRVLNLQGTTNVTGTGGVGVGNSGVVNNSGTFNMGPNEFFEPQFLSSGVFNNSGVLNVAAGSASAVFSNTPMNNSGTVNVTTGTLELDSGGTQSGAFNTSPGAATYFAGGTAVMNAGSALNGAGLYHISGTMTANVALTAANLTIDSNGLNGPATVTITGAFNWIGGSLDGPGTTVVSAGATANLSGAGNKFVTNSRILNLQGTTNVSGTGGVGVGNSGVVNNSGTFNMGPNVFFTTQFMSSGVFNSSGVLNVAAGSASAVFSNTPMNNSGTVNVTTGTLELDLGGTHTGTFAVSTGALLSLNGGTNMLSGANVKFNGTGTVALTSGAISPVLAGATLTASPNVFKWNGGVFSIPIGATLNYSGTLGIVGSNDMVITGGGTFNLVGTVNQTGTGNLRLDGSGTTSTTINIPAGSTYNLANNSGIINGGGFGGIVANAGTIAKTAGIGSSTITAQLNSGAAINVNTGTLVLAPVGGTETGGVFTIASGAVLDLTGGQTVSYGGTYTGSGAGQIQLNSGTLNVVGGSNGATLNFPSGLFVWSGGTINVNNTTLTIPSTSRVQLTSNGGTALTGGASGVLAVNGTVTQSGLGSLQLNNGTTLSLGGLYNITNDSGIVQGNGGGGVIAIAASGALEKTLGTSTSTVSATLNNAGKVYSMDGNLNLGGTVVQLSGGTLTGGQWAAFGTSTTTATLTIGATKITTIGVGATVTLSGPHSSIVDLSGLATVNGTFILSNGQSFSTPGALIDAGAITIGAGSTLTVNGNFTETSAGTLTVQIGGTPTAPTIGVLAVSGAVSLGGALSVTGTVTPPVNTVLKFLVKVSAGAISGTFVGLPQGSTITIGTAVYRISYVGGDGNDVTLTRIS